jgi:hypothetical protein
VAHFAVRGAPYNIQRQIDAAQRETALQASIKIIEFGQRAVGIKYQEWLHGSSVASCRASGLTGRICCEISLQFNTLVMRERYP